MKRGDAASTELVPIEQFKAFVRSIVSVPKKEIDEKREAARQRKRARHEK